MKTSTTRSISVLVGALAAITVADPVFAVAPPVGSRAVLSTFAHSVSGTVEVTSASTLRVTDFYFDGGGVNVYFTLAASDSSSLFGSSGRYIGPPLLGNVFTGQTLDLTLEAGETFDGIGAVSVWCIPFSANFGSGTFSCPTDFDGDGFVTGDDFDAYVVAFTAGDMAADFDSDGFVTGDDFDAFVQAFERGC